MGADQWKPILVIAYLFERDLPTLHRMATLAVRAELAAMNVRMAVRAACTHILEDGANMTFCTGYFFVHAAQWIACVVVVKFWIRADGFPAGEGVAITAGSGDWAMRIRDLGLRSADGSLPAFGGLAQRYSCE